VTISIIIPSFNQQEFLADAIESTLSQTRKPDEIIVINDGSTDHSFELAKGYETQGVKVIDQVNKGLAAARNTGLMNATSDYILPLDADDILAENCVEEILKRAEATDADIIAPSFKTFGVSNQLVILAENLLVKDFVVANRIAYFSAYKRLKAIAIGGYQTRLDNQFRDEQGKLKGGYEDLHFWMDLLKRGATLSVIQEPLVLYRTRPNTMIAEAQAHHDTLMQQIIKDHQVVYQEAQN
jgi:glycosyltransferase involved in cell wall biosynthesis